MLPKVNRDKNLAQSQEKMTPERLRRFKGFENYSTEQAQETIDQLEEFARIICRHIITKKII